MYVKCRICEKPIEDNQSRVLFYWMGEILVYVHRKCRESAEKLKRRS